MKESTERELKYFFEENKKLGYLKKNVVKITEAFSNIRKPNKILICGNGGSAADSAHIVGELMKEFKIRRELDADFCKRYSERYGADFLAHLNGAIPAVSLVVENSLITALINDIGSESMFAQQVYGMGVKGDILIGISTSGNSKAVIQALCVANALGMMTVGMTGQSGGKIKGEVDYLLNVPENETYRVQEIHSKLYHLICACAETERWG